ncbi:MFS transporter [Brevibacillus choshinensis]|uniref:MFS transporter n=1 Tax=Brevibacillus choshinensis TaxID=54911 RepID=A0ABR5N8F7_BRECH|nr:MFS transporter [Brevibacillus choshinensis]KQL46916.1 MFS transporter [Brevibacillus choshinensis]
MKQDSSIRFHYAWVIAGVTFFILLIGAGIRSAPGVFMVPVEQEFGWSRSAISFALSINLLLYGLVGPFAAAVMDRFGIRRITMIALLMLALGSALTTWMQASWQLTLLWGIVVGLGSGCTASVLGAMIANRWFIQHRGLVMGVLTASGATGQLLFLPLLASMAESAGWRTATWIISVVALIMVPVVMFFMRDRPSDKGLKAYGATEADEELTAPKQNPFHTAIQGLFTGLRSFDFWLLAGSFFICGLSTNGLIGTHFIAACMEHGIPAVTAASLLALIGVFDIIGTTFSGWLSDRFNNRWLLFWYYGLRGLSLMWLPTALSSSTFSLGLFIVFYGLDWVATVPPTLKLTTDIFGRQQAGILFGWILAAHQLGAAVAAYGGGVVYTMLNSYFFMFIVAGAFCLLASLMVMRIGRNALTPSVSRNM